MIIDYLWIVGFMKSTISYSIWNWTLRDEFVLNMVWHLKGLLVECMGGFLALGFAFKDTNRFTLMCRWRNELKLRLAVHILQKKMAELNICQK